MKFFIIITLVASLAGLALSQTDPVDKKCVEMHCKDEFSGCTGDSMCMKAVSCIDGCWKNWDADTSAQKLVVQNCTTKCAVSYADDAFVKALECMVTNNCITFPSIPSVCKGNNVTMAKNIPASELAGDWNVLKGYNTVYDCYPCDKNTIDPSAGNVDISFDAFGVDDTTKPMKASGTFKANSPKPGFNVSITEAGAPVAFTWWVFDRIDDTAGKYYLFYYCGSTSMWNYEGAMVKSKATMVSQSAMSAISASFQTNVGLDFSKFCSPKVEGCT